MNRFTVNFLLVECNPYLFNAKLPQYTTTHVYLFWIPEHQTPRLLCFTTSRIQELGKQNLYGQCGCMLLSSDSVQSYLYFFAPLKNNLQRTRLVDVKAIQNAASQQIHRAKKLIRRKHTVISQSVRNQFTSILNIPKSNCAVINFIAPAWEIVICINLKYQETEYKFSLWQLPSFFSNTFACIVLVFHIVFYWCSA
jgi:hypothetical protein